MARQLSLLDTRSPAWRIDDTTREVGRRGIASARASLQAAIAANHPVRADATSQEHPSHGRSAA